MPGKDKQNYPPCNRAFALRMMNPMSYREGNVSPLDRQIQPVVKRQIAKNVESRKGSIDDNSSSSMSSTTSYTESGLYDIDEHDHQRYRYSSGGNGTPNTPRRNTVRTKSTSNLMTRSYTSADGFSIGNFSRNVTARSTMPSRLRSKSSSKGSVSANTTPRNENKETSSSLKRTQSLRERPKSALGISRPSTSHGQNNSAQILKKTSSSSNVTSLRKPSRSKDNPKKCSTLRKEKTYNGINGVHSRRDDDSTESDNSSVMNDIDSFKQTYRATSNGCSSLGSSTITLNGSVSSYGDSSLESSFDSAVQLSVASCSSLNTSSLKDDSFSEKLSDICTLISQRYPGDFQILENLVEMQSAYEQRNEQVNKVVKNLEQNVHNLNRKISQASRLTNLIAPLMQVTRSFEKELLGVMEANSKVSKETHEQYTQIPSVSSQEKEDNFCNGHENSTSGQLNGLPNDFGEALNGKHPSPLEEIHSEANAVANKIMEGIAEQQEKNAFA